MSQIITVKINVDLIDKERIFEGKKGRYLDLVMIPTPESQYGDFLVKQSGDRDEKMPILGNGKYLKPKNEAVQNDEPESDLPF